MIVTLTLPLAPSTNALFRNARKGRICTDAYRAWKTEAGWCLKQQHPAKIAGPVELEIWIEEPKGKRKIDLDNRAKGLLDLLVAHRVIEDDNSEIVRSIKLSWKSIEGCVVQVVSVAAVQGVAA